MNKKGRISVLIKPAAKGCFTAQRLFASTKLSLFRTKSVMSADKIIQGATPGVLTVQNCYLSYHLVKRNLERADVRVNGHLKQRIDVSKYPALTTDKFTRAEKTLENVNDSFMTRHKDNVMTLVLTLDTSDGQLHAEFLKAAGQVVDEIRWGRVASLFFLTSLLCERLYKEGQGAKIDSMVEWLAQFLDDHVSYWIQQRGGWVSVHVLT